MIENAYHNCMRCMNCRVRILTTEGHTHEGTIVKVDNCHVYLKVDCKRRVHTSGLFNPYAGDILTLSLFTLLAIALI
ncbi:hypothetical protein [Paenibacillus sp. IHBB 10380]|uniref:hypothetical protein n=1 Tax=Paenibacillus sp. IHBB 10380 TaxID=1566358 RepID=UPI0009E2433D|nr:hypothetical protein [Paenibacillus sp. IHBB 10380]